MSEREVSIKVTAYDRLTKPIRAMKGVVRSMGAPIRRLKRQIKEVGQAAGFDKLSRSVRKLRDRLGGLRAGFTSTMRRISGIAAIGTGAAASLFALTNSAAKTGDEAAKLARQLGLSAEALQEYRFAADRQGVAQATLDSSLGAFSKRLGELRGGYGAMRAALKKTNPEILRQLMATKDTEEALQLYMRAIEEAGTAADKSALAAAGFSRSGMVMTRVAEAGAEGIAALRKEARELGIVIPQDQANAAEGFVDAMTNAQQAVRGLRLQIGTGLMATFKPLVTRFTELVKVNRELIVTNVVKWAKRGADAFRSLMNPTGELRVGLERIIDRVTSAWRSFKRISEVVGGPVNVALAGLAAFVLGPMITATASLVTALTAVGFTATGVAAKLGALAVTGAAKALAGITVGVRALSLALITNPIGAAITAIAVVVTGLALAVRKYWEPLSAFVKGFFQGFVSAIQPAREALRPLIDAVSRAASVISEAFGPVIKPVASAIGAIVEAVTSLLDPVTHTAEELTSAANAGRNFGEVVGRVVVRSVQLLAKPVQLATEAIAGIRRALMNLDARAAVGGIVDGIVSFFAGLPDRILDALSGAASRIADALTPDLGFSPPRGTPGVSADRRRGRGRRSEARRSPGVTQEGRAFAKGGMFKAGRVIPFAKGGIIRKPTTFPMSAGRTGLMAEAGAEAIMPLRRGRGGRLGVEVATPGVIGRSPQAAASQAPQINLGGVTINVDGSGHDPQAIAEMVVRQIEEQAFSASSGQRAALYD